MVDTPADYRFVVGASPDADHPHGDLDRLVVDGNILPLRGGEVVRGEDLAFLREAAMERVHVGDFYEETVNPLTVSAVVSSDTTQVCIDNLKNIDRREGTVQNILRGIGFDNTNPFLAPTFSFLRTDIGETDAQNVDTGSGQPDSSLLKTGLDLYGDCCWHDDYAAPTLRQRAPVVQSDVSAAFDFIDKLDKMLVTVPDYPNVFPRNIREQDRIDAYWDNSWSGWSFTYGSPTAQTHKDLVASVHLYAYLGARVYCYRSGALANCVVGKVVSLGQMDRQHGTYDYFTKSLSASDVETLYADLLRECSAGYPTEPASGTDTYAAYCDLSHVFAVLTLGNHTRWH